ncbi:MAG: DUF4293 domain-containing protein [Bacteroidota bacterium]|nr:DUF4293 domain-containing protein [Bacteroidota bacterium]
MIQRIQSLYLFLAAVALGLVFFFPLANLSNIQDLVIFKITGFSKFSVLENIPTWPLIIMNVVTLLLTLIIIGLYKKRPLQVRLTRIALMLNVIFIALMYFVYGDHLAKQIKMDINYEIGSLFPIISMIFQILAMYAINKDERLIKSVDRIR